jgi:predicted AAA+ superfamily ATPase
MATIVRPLVNELLKRLSQRDTPLQIVMGPRQVGKTTAVQQVMERWQGVSHYASADLPFVPDPFWVQSQWEIARRHAHEGKTKTLLVLDEIQKVSRWAEMVKSLSEEDRRKGIALNTILLGSSALQIQAGSKESLAGRFELHFCPHWSWPECREAFGWGLDQWIYFGGYPGAAPFVKDHPRWVDYIVHSLIEAVLSRDVLQMTRIDKPALLRQLFLLAAKAPARLISFNKMLGQLQDAGNTVTLAHYLRLLGGAYLVSGLNLWSRGILRSKASSPKLIVWNNALTNALSSYTFEESRDKPEEWGWLVENAVGAHLLNYRPTTAEIFFWRHGNNEVDFIMESGDKAVAFEVKSGRHGKTHGLSALKKQHPSIKPLMVGTGGIPLETFFSSPPEVWL